MWLSGINKYVAWPGADFHSKVVDILLGNSDLYVEWRGGVVSHHVVKHAHLEEKVIALFYTYTDDVTTLRPVYETDSCMHFGFEEKKFL